MATTITSQDGELLDRLVGFLQDYYREEMGELAEHYPREQRSLTIDYHDLFRFDPDVADDYLEHPARMRTNLEEAVRLFDLPIAVELSNAHVRVTNLPADMTYSVGEYRATEAGSFIGVRGQVKKKSEVKPQIQHAAFECQRCGTVTQKPQQGTEFREPAECQGCDRNGPFETDVEGSEFEDFQLVRVQQPPEETKGGDGAFVDVELHDDLVEAVEAGDRVTLSGVLELKQTDTDSLTFDPYLAADAADIEETDFQDIDIDQFADALKAHAAGEHGDPYDLLVDSIAPGLTGEKARTLRLAAALQLFRGVRSKRPNQPPVRGDSHILFLGDPSTGKSQILRAVDHIAPRSTYASGQGMTAAGATAAAVRDDFANTEWTLEAGSLVLADGGVACIDEIDKVQDDAVSSMHDALESPQSVEISKAGINATLPSRTSLLAAGNPVYGRFDPYEPIGEQFDISPSLLARFDLIFTLKDRPDENRDREIGESIVEGRTRAHRYDHADGELDEDELAAIEPALDLELLRAWIAYARQHVHPVTPPEIQRQIVSAYVSFRNEVNRSDDVQGMDPVPITARKIAGIQRLAEASARVRLSGTVEQEDVERATSLVRESLVDVGKDPDSGEFDADIVETGVSKSQKDRLKVLEGVIQSEEEEDEHGAELQAIISAMEDMGYTPGRIKSDLDKLSENGVVYTTVDDAHYRWLGY